MLRSKTGLLLAGVAAYAAYKWYSKMDPAKKKDMVDSLKQKGKDLVDKFVPQNVRDQFSETAGKAESSFKPGY